jgi:DNA mismatch endonuclease (patch repair protein)
VKAPIKPDAARGALVAWVRQKDTGPEQAVARALRSRGARYRKNVRSLPGSPDFANRSRKWAVFVHGCFWHRHTGCRRATTPKARQASTSERHASATEEDYLAFRASVQEFIG